MKQIYQTNLGIKVKDVPIPFPNDNEVQIKVFNSLISVGTEANSMKTKTWTQKYEILKQRIEKSLDILKTDGFKVVYNKVVSTISSSNVESKYEPIGYSNSGIIVSKGKNVTNLNVGDRVACGGNTFAVHGEVAIIPKNLAVKIPKNVTFEEAAFTTVGSIAMQGIRRSEARPGEWVIIYGVGLLGLIAVQIAKSWGLHVMAIDINDDKLKLAKECGADKIINSITSKNIAKTVNACTNGYGVDASIIYASTSSSDPVNSSFTLCREKANIVIVGAVGMDLEREEFYRKEQNLIISTSYGPGRYDDEYELKGHDYPIGYVRWTENRNMQEFVSLMSLNKVDINKLLTSTNSVEEAPKIYQKLASPLNDEIGVLFKFKYEIDNKEIFHRELIPINSDPLLKDQMNIGVIGAGGYVKSYILPNLQNNKNCNLVGLCNKTSHSSLETGKSAGFNYITGNYKDLLKDDTIDWIIIGTRHDLHAKLTLEALQHNKNVFVEKPLSLDIEGINKIREELNKTKTKLFIGFNRRYSSLIQELKSKLTKRENPIMINFRINAGHIPVNSWVQDPLIGGGRIIGEGCHFIDLCNYIVEDEIKSFDINSISTNNNLIKSDDNYVLTINYKDGSMAIIFYTSIGGSKQPKELLEVYAEGNSYVVDDFTIYSEYSGTNIKTNKLNEQDKGREVQIQEILRNLKGKTSLIPNINYDINASLLSILAQERIHGKK